MLDGQDWMDRQHPRAGPAHDGPDLLPHFRLITVDLARRAEGFCLHKRAMVDAGQCIVVELLALRAERAFGGVVLPAAVERDHLADQKLFFFALFDKIFGGVFGHSFLLNHKKAGFWQCQSPAGFTASR